MAGISAWISTNEKNVDIWGHDIYPYREKRTEITKKCPPIVSVPWFCFNAADAYTLYRFIPTSNRRTSSFLPCLKFRYDAIPRRRTFSVLNWHSVVFDVRVSNKILFKEKPHGRMRPFFSSHDAAGVCQQENTDYSFRDIFIKDFRSE